MNCSQVTADMASVLINLSPILLHLAVQSGHKESAQPWDIRIAQCPSLVWRQICRVVQRKGPRCVSDRGGWKQGEVQQHNSALPFVCWNRHPRMPHKTGLLWGDSNAQQHKGTQRGQSSRCGNTAYFERSPLAQREVDLYNFWTGAMWEEWSPHLLFSAELGGEIRRNFLRSPESKQHHPSQRQSVAVCTALHLPGWIQRCWTPTDPITGGTGTSFIQNTNMVVFRLQHRTGVKYCDWTFFYFIF